MAKVLAQRELRNHNAQVIDAVAAGESFIVTRNGEPVAELRPAKHMRRTFISATRSRSQSFLAARSTATSSGPISTG
jgi:prevent-host-death family protein